MSIESIRAIDVHAHYGRYFRPEFTDEANSFMTADGPTVARRAARANTALTIVSPLLGLMPRGAADAAAGNDEALRVVADTPGLLQWVIVDPLQPATYDQARRMLREPGCVGIKIHPEEHVYPIREHGQDLFAFAAEQHALVLAHSGDEHSVPLDFVPFADAFPEVSLILAHLGNGGAAAGDPTLQVRAIQAARRGNVYTDTSSARSVTPGLIEWAVGEIGADPILYGTDSPCYFPGCQRARIDQAEVDDDVKRKILRKNAEALLARHGHTVAAA